MSSRRVQMLGDWLLTTTGADASGGKKNALVIIHFLEKEKKAMTMTKIASQRLDTHMVMVLW